MAGWMFVLHVELLILAGQSCRSMVIDGVSVWWTNSMH